MSTVVPAVAGSIPDMKRLRELCRAEGIAAEIGCPPGAAGKGWGTKTHLLVEETELPRIADLLKREWNALVGDDLAEVDMSGDACPACGCTAPLDAGACAECGLQLEF